MQMWRQNTPDILFLLEEDGFEHLCETASILSEPKIVSFAHELLETLKLPLLGVSSGLQNALTQFDHYFWGELLICHGQYI